jgi:hypothetical protein
MPGRDLNSMDIEPKAEWVRLPFMRNAEEMALRALAVVLGFLYGLEVKNGKMDGFKVLMPGGGLIPSGIKENKKWWNTFKREPCHNVSKESRRKKDES